MKRNLAKEKRIRRIRAKISGTSQRPRLAIFRSLQHIYGQLIDDERGQTLASTSDKQLKGKKSKSPAEIAKMTGELLGKKANKLSIKDVVVDRRGSKFHGQIKAFVEGFEKGQKNE